MADKLKSILSWWPVVLCVCGLIGAQAVNAYLTHQNNAELAYMRQHGTEISRAEVKEQRILHEEIEKRMKAEEEECKRQREIAQSVGERMAKIEQKLEDIGNFLGVPQKAKP